MTNLYKCILDLLTTVVAYLLVHFMADTTTWMINNVETTYDMPLKLELFITYMVYIIFRIWLYTRHESPLVPRLEP